MAINPNNGVLDIVNGVLKVSSIDIKQAGGFTTAINTVARNDVLLFDDQKATTTFMPTPVGGYMSSTGVTRDTTEGAGYLELGTSSEGGWVYWPLQLPNSWHAEFDMHVTAIGGVLTFSLFNTSTPNHTDYTANDGGYKIVFDNTQNQIDIYWEGSIHKTVSASLRSSEWQHVNINYFQGHISVSLAGKVVLTHEFTQNYQEFDSRYIGFSATAGVSHKIRHLRVHNSDKWLYTKTSNASDIAYVSGNVGIGTLSPTQLLDVHGNVHIAKDLTVNGNLTVSGTTTFIDTTNMAVEDPIIELARGNASDTVDAGLIITRATSNVAIAYRGDEGELALGYTQSGASGTDVVPVADGGLDVRVYGNLFANNLTTTANVEASYLKGDGSEITQVTLDQVVGYANTTGNTIQLTNTDVGLVATGNVEANYFVGDGSKLTGLVTTLEDVANNGNTISNVIQFTNATTAFVTSSNVGVGTTAPTADLHVVGYQYVNDPPAQSASFDHSDAPLTLTHATPTSTTTLNDPKPVLHLTRDGTASQTYGARASFNLSRYENSGTASRSRLDVALTDGTYAESTVMTLRADGRVGVGTTAPGYMLDVHGTANVGALSATTVAATTFTGSMSTSLSPGSYLTGTAYNGSTARTFAVDATTTNTASKVVARDASGDIFCRLVRPDYTDQTTISGAMAYRVSTTDNYIRFCSDKGAIRTFLELDKVKQINGYTEVDINSPDGVSGTWTTATTSSWGDPKFNNTYDNYRYNDAPGHVQYNIPTGMKSAYISQLQWNTGGYVDVHGVQSDGGLVFLRRINTRQAVENTNEGNPDQHDGQTITFIGSGLDTFTAIRLTNKVGRFHMDGLAFTPNPNEGTEGTGMVHSGQISDLGIGIPTPTGTGASGTWGISITGNAGTSSSCSGNSATATTATNQSGGTVTCTSGTFSGTFSASSASSRDKFRVYPAAAYCIGMQSGVTFGDLNDWSMTFQMNDNDVRGFWWGDDGHSVAQGAMSLSTRGWLNVAERIKVGGGQSDTGGPGDTLHVVGDAYVNGRRLDVHSNQTRFTGYHYDASYRAQIILSSAYSDLIIASSQANDNHGSNLSFAAYNPSNSNDYRKFVINQGNWGARKQFLDFGYEDSAIPNPHSAINSTDVMFTLDGINKRVGIRNMNPAYNLDVNGNARINRLFPYSYSYGSGYNTAAIEVREYGMEGATGGTEWARAPRIGFHWSGRVASQIMMDANGTIMAVNNPGNAYENFNAAQVYASTAFYTDGGRSVIRGGSPTLYFRDTNHYSGMIHCNSNLLYILRGGTDTESWSAVNGQWPFIFNLANNDATCGGNFYIKGTDLLIQSGWSSGSYYRIMGYNSDKQIQFSYNEGTVISDNGTIKFCVGGYAGTGGAYEERMRINSSGHVGIGTASPSVPLTIWTSASPSVNNSATTEGSSRNKYWAHATHGWMSSGDSSWYEAISLYAYEDIVGGSHLILTTGALGASDRRIKTNIQEINDASALNELRKLQPKTYEYIDKAKHGDDTVYGFIAQEVKEVMPYATRTRIDYIPNIQELAEVSESNVITFSTFTTSNFENTTLPFRIRLIDKSSVPAEVMVEEIIDDKSIRVDKDLSSLSGDVDENGTVIAGSKILVYGEQVTDFVYLKKESIWTVATAALQEVDRQQQADKVRIAELEAQLASVLARLDALENPPS